MSDIQEQIKLAHKKAEENDYYFKKNNELSSLNTSLRSQRDELQNRINKAIELIKDDGLYEEDTNTFCGEIYFRLPELLNLLQGVDKE